MRNTVLLIDANVIISYITNRRPGFDEAAKILDWCRDEHSQAEKDPAEARRDLFSGSFTSGEVTAALTKNIFPNYNFGKR